MEIKKEGSHTDNVLDALAARQGGQCSPQAIKLPWFCCCFELAFFYHTFWNDLEENECMRCELEDDSKYAPAA